MGNSLTSSGLTLGSPQYGGTSTLQGIEVLGGGIWYSGETTVKLADVTFGAAYYYYGIAPSYVSTYDIYASSSPRTYTVTLPSINVGTYSVWARKFKISRITTSQSTDELEVYLPSTGTYLVRQDGGKGASNSYYVNMSEQSGYTRKTYAGTNVTTNLIYYDYIGTSSTTIRSGGAYVGGWSSYTPDASGSVYGLLEIQYYRLS